MVPWSRPSRYASGVNERVEVAERAAAAYSALAELAESVEDEWQYVTDLVDAYLPGIRALAGADAGRAPATEAVAAVDEAIAEIGLISDPHRAIDWLSTFPHVVALALGGDLGRPAEDGSGRDGSHAAEPVSNEPDADSPFRALRGYR
jgi:hypothetical protein